MRISLRARLTAAVVVLAALGVIAADIATATALRSFLLDRVDRSLFAARQPLMSRGRFDEPRDPLNLSDYYVELRDVAGRVVARSKGFRNESLPLPLMTDAVLRAPGAAREPVTVAAVGGGSPYRVLVTRLSSGGTLILGVSLGDLRATERRLFLIEAIVTLAALAAIGALAAWFVRLGLRPLTEMESTAAAIAGGDLTRRVPHTDDGTEVGRLGGAFNRMLEQIEAAFAERRLSEERLRRFVADASHELRTPLTSIRGYAELFRQGAGERPEDLAKSMRRIEEEAERMGVLVEDLLLLARLDQGRPLERAPVDLRALVADAVDDARAVEPDRPISFDAGEDVIVTGDEGRLRQVAANLLDNVRVHTPPGTAVRVDVRAREGVAVLEVADDGPGMDEETAAHAFERFFRADPSRARERGGSGLGLSIVAAIAHAHGGSVSVRSEPGAGATFTVEIPVGQTDPDHPVESLTSVAQREHDA